MIKSSVTGDRSGTTAAGRSVSWTWFQAMHDVPWESMSDAQRSWWIMVNVFEVMRADPKSSNGTKRAMRLQAHGCKALEQAAVDKNWSHAWFLTTLPDPMETKSGAVQRRR